METQKTINESIALAVDLDGTLLKTNSLWEIVLYVLARKPWFILILPGWLLAGRAKFKKKVGDVWNGSVKHWPYNPLVLDEISRARNIGRKICLATAANEKVAGKIASHLKVFDFVIASTKEANRKGSEKAAWLCEKFGEQGFDYIGDSIADMPVWLKARQAILVVGANANIIAKVRKTNNNFRVLPHAPPGAQHYLKQIRAHQWLKNLLVFAPVFTGWERSADTVSGIFLTFVSFCLCASMIYLINDLMDLPADRRHPIKKTRPFAAGIIPLGHGVALVGVFAAACIAIAWYLPFGIRVVLVVYFAVNMLYSGWLKQVAMLDIIILAGFYVIRVYAGCFAMSQKPSNWFLGFTCFMFMGLALIKRSAELIVQRRAGGLKAHGRFYQVGDESILQNMAVACGFCSITILSLYIDSLRAAQAYTRPSLLWLICPIICYWYGRLLLLTHRGRMHSDPIRFVMKDQVSIGAILAGVLVVIIAI